MSYRAGFGSFTGGVKEMVPTRHLQSVSGTVRHGQAGIVLLGDNYYSIGICPVLFFYRLAYGKGGVLIDE